MRLRNAAGVSRQAAPAPDLTPRERLLAALLYVITPDAGPDHVLHLAEDAQRGGADVVQLRQKALPRGELLSLARRMRELLRDALFIVNDHVDIALLSGADGVHLGQDDLSVASARKVAGDALIIGASASSAEAARRAVAAGADYVGSGPAFATPIKAQKQVIGPQGVAEISKALEPEVPVFAIGGVDAMNLGHLTAAGVHRACVIRAVADATDPEQAARHLRAMLSSR
jgi:thiamine-phosphate pyrophosphorylase